MKKVTIRDVAKEAGVSYVTVSNAINDTGRMSEETKKKVMLAVKKLNFYPDSSARTLASGKSGTIAFISSYLSSPFVTSVLSAVEKRLFETGKFAHSLAHFATRGAQQIKEKLINEILYGKKADAAIMVTIKPSDAMVREFKRRKMPLVLIENLASGAHSILVDNYAGAYNAVSYLASSGRKKIAIINGPKGPSVYDEENSPVIDDRHKAYIHALKNSGLKVDKRLCRNASYFTTEKGSEAFESLIRENPGIDAVFCAAGDMAALGVMQKARELKIKIPGDIALVGYDDMPVAAIMSPSLTTVRQPIEDMGRHAFDMAIGALDGALKEPAKISLKPRLIIRESA